MIRKLGARGGSARPRPLVVALDRDFFFYRLYLLPRVCDVAPYLFGCQPHRHGIVVDGDAENRHDEDIQAERDDSAAAEILRTEIGEHSQPDEVRPHPGCASPVEVRGQFRRVDDMTYAEEHEAEDHCDEHMPDNVPGAPVDDQVRHDKGEHRQHLAGRQLEGPWVVWLLAPHRAEGERHRRVTDDGRRDDETDECLPSWERQEHKAADKEAEDDAHDRHTPIAEVAELPRDVVVASEGVREARAGSRVDEPGPCRGNKGVYVKKRREPAGAHYGRKPGEGTCGPRESELRPPVFELFLGIEGTKESDLQCDVQDDPDRHRADDGERDVALRVLGLCPELDGLLEALVGEYYPPEGYRAQHALNPVGGEAAGRGEV